MDFENPRKRFAKIAIISATIISANAIWFFLHWMDFEKSMLLLLMPNIVVMWILMFTVAPACWPIKDDIVWKMASEIDENLSYDSWDKFDFSKALYLKKWLLESYNASEIVEDTMCYNHSPKWTDPSVNNLWWLNIYSCEFTSFNVTRNSKWEKTESCNNNAILTKIIINNPTRTVQKDIILRANSSYNYWSMILWSLLFAFCLSPLIYIALLIVYFMTPMKPYVAIIFDPSWDYHRFSSYIIIGASAIIIIIFSMLFRKKKKIRTENVEFDKEFNIECEDQIEARKLLTPDFMYRLYDFVNAIDWKRKYEFIFTRNEIYMKRDLKTLLKSITILKLFPLFWWYMEVSYFKDIIKNIEQLLESYIELKWVARLADDLWLYYFDKDTVMTEIINN
jgi:hypothetical protein